jgi:hypothetical protein
MASSLFCVENNTSSVAYQKIKSSLMIKSSIMTLTHLFSFYPNKREKKSTTK